MGEVNTAPQLAAVMRERHRQLEKWGVQRYKPGPWLAILGEEFGEVCEAAGPLMGLGTGKPTDADDLYAELIQVAAVAVAWAEQIAEERGGANGGKHVKHETQYISSAEESKGKQ